MPKPKKARHLLTINKMPKTQPQTDSAAKNILINLELKKEPKASKLKNNLVKGYKPMDNRQVTHNLRRRMGR